MKILAKLVALALGTGVIGVSFAFAQTPVQLVGASQYGDDHSFTKTLQRFEELVREYYDGPVEVVLHKNGALGTDLDMFNFMTQGISVDFALLSPSHMAGHAPAAPVIDMPFLFRDTDHWQQAIEEGVLDPIAEEVAEKADVMFIGYGGGGVRNINSTRQVRTLDDLQGLRIRVQGAPIWSSAFGAIGLAPAVISYDEVYGALQNGVIAAHENAIAAINQRRHYEVAPFLLLTQHAIETRPLAFPGKRFRELPPELQQAILRAGKEATNYGRNLEISGAAEMVQQLVDEGSLTVSEFADKEEFNARAAPAVEAYAEELGATEIVKNIRALQ